MKYFYQAKDTPIRYSNHLLNRYTVRGSIVGTRKDMQEAIAFAVEGKVKATVHPAKLEDINTVFDEMKKGEIEGRVVLEIAKPYEIKKESIEKRVVMETGKS